jgi:site-specific DNA-methyltransferase (adenine-specific)
VNPLDLFQDLTSRGVALTPHGGKLIVDAPAGVLTEADRDALSRLKPDVLAILTTRRTPEELPQDWRVDWEERAAILEYDGGQPRDRAEELALAEIVGQKRLNPSPCQSPLNINSLLTGDSRDVLPTLPAGVADLVVTDPPFNIGYSYPGYDDSRPDAEYLAMLEDVFRKVGRVLNPAGSLFVAIGAKYQAEVCVLLKRLGFHWRRTIIWHYTFGTHQKTNFTPSYTPILYFTAEPKRFTFRRDDILVPSARQLVYNDARASHGGKTPDDVWLLRPQEAEGFFEPDSDAWHVPRVAGTFRERVAHSCQMPLAILGRIVKVASNPGEVVLDPFAGSGSTLVAAKNLGRKFIGIELDEGTTRLARGRLEKESPGA